MIRTQRLGFVLAPLCLMLGVWQMGNGTYIYLKATLAQYLLGTAWERTLQGERRSRPWSWSDTWPVARMGIKRLGVDQIILSGASGRTLAFGPGQVAGTALPGSRGNSVISAHRDTHFGFLKQLIIGDTIRIERPDGQSIEYRVEHVAIRHQDDIWLLDPTPDHQLTLISCYPFDAIMPGGPLRYVVTARLSGGATGDYVK